MARAAAVVEAAAGVVAVLAVSVKRLKALFIEVLLTSTVVAAATVTRCELLCLTWSGAVA